MKYWYQQPSLFLQDYVKTVLIIEGFSPPVPAMLPLVTTGMPVFLCRVENDENGNGCYFQLSLFGTSASADCWSVNEATTIIAFFFKPFSMATLFNLEAAKLKEATLELHDWDAHKTNAVKTQLSLANTTEQKIEIIEHLLTMQLKQQWKECELIRKTTDEMMFQTDTGILETIMEKLDINQRTFQRLFKKYVGVTPTQYRRICQFQLSFAQLRNREFIKLTDIAFDNGFADQSHFIRSFKEFTQTTPNDYLRSGLKKN